MNLLTSAVVVQRCLGMGLARACDAGKIPADAKMSLFTADGMSWAEATCVFEEEMRVWIRGELLRPLLQLSERISLEHMCWMKANAVKAWKMSSPFVVAVQSR